jgi:hypothetical protein
MQTFPTSAGRRGRSTPPVRTIALHGALALLVAAGGYSLARRLVGESVADPVIAAPPTVVASVPPLPRSDLDGLDSPIAGETPPPAFDSGQYLPTWPPCSTVTVRLDATVPETAADVVLTEARTVLLLAGHPVVEAGSVDLGLMDDPERVRLVAEGELVIGLTTEGRLGGDVVGTAVASSQGEHIVAGLVVVDESLLGTEHFLPVLRHEMGHAVGLPHVDDPAELMYPTRLPGAPDSFQAADLAALAAISAQPCEVTP